MHVLESAYRVTRKSLHRANTVTFENRVLSIRLTNSTDKRLRIERTQVVAGSFSASFDELAPGQAGTLRFSSSEGSLLSATKSFCHHAGVVELRVGDEHLYVAQAHPIGQSIKKNNSFAFSFGPPNADLKQFYKKMPPEFMGSIGCPNSAKAEGSELMALAMASSTSEVDMLLAGEECTTFLDMESLQHLRYAELCQQHQPGLLLCALFVADYMAVVNALPGIDLIDRAFTLDMLIVMFVYSDFVGLSRQALGNNLQLWKRKRAGPVAACFGKLDYQRYLELDQDLYDIEAHVESALLLLSAAAGQAMRKMHGIVLFFKEQGLWGEVERMAEYHMGIERSDVQEHSNANDSFIMEHLKSEAMRQRPSLFRHGSSMEGVGSEGVFTRLVCKKASMAPARRKASMTSTSSWRQRASQSSRSGRPSWASGDSPDIDPVELLKIMVRHCIHTGADHTSRRSALFEAAAEVQMSDEDGETILHYCQTLPLSQHVFETGESCGLPATLCKVYSMGGLAALDGGEVASPQLVLESLGYSAVEYKSLATNSKSGEFFFISDDKRFLVKTISSNESVLLRKMLTAYQHHIRTWSLSLIVRFAGLFHVEAPDVGLSQFFIVMRSVFNPAYAIHETFDLKGSLFHRKRKEGESIGKDEDWIEARRAIALPRPLQRQLSAMHEVDIELLRRFDVMDYSLLVGVHELRADEDAPLVAEGDEQAAWRIGGGILSEDGKTLYFVGLIDFLILYDLNKEAENLIRVVQGHGQDASCVSPPEYAMRQAAFIRERVLACRPDEPGTLGMLQARIGSASNLLAMDWLGTSDPYVRVTLGLFARQTDHVLRNCNPKFDRTIFLPVNESHASQMLDVSVWDWDENKALRGTDDFLGRIVVPMYQILNGPVCFTNEPLLDVSKGTLSVTFIFEPRGHRESMSLTDSIFSAFAVSHGISSVRSVQSAARCNHCDRLPTSQSWDGDMETFAAFAVDSMNSSTDLVSSLRSQSMASIGRTRSSSAPPTGSGRLTAPIAEEPPGRASQRAWQPSRTLADFELPPWPPPAPEPRSILRRGQDASSSSPTANAAGNSGFRPRMRVTVKEPLAPPVSVPDSTDPPEDDDDP